MEPLDQSSEFLVQKAKEAAVFGHSQRWQVLLACAHADRSLSQLQRMFGLSLSKLHYHVGRLVESGLLSVSRVEPRGGRAIRYYRAVADTFVVPQELLPAPPRDRFEKELRQSLRALAIRRDLFLVYTSDAAGRSRVQIRDCSDAATRARAIELWKVARLTPARRLELAQEMQALLARYGLPGDAPEGEPVLIHLAYAPVPPRPQ